MQDSYLRAFARDTCPFPPRKTLPNIMIAVPFVVCFSIFGIFNLVGGTILTIMSCRSTMSQRAMELLRKLARTTDVQLDTHIDPMQVVGIMLLLTGSLLVVIGLALGITACRSVDDHQRRKQLRLGLSGLPLYSFPDRGSRRTSSVFSTSFVSGRSRVNGKKSLEKTVSPILEVNGEDEVQECETLTIDVHKGYTSITSLRELSASGSPPTVQFLQTDDAREELKPLTANTHVEIVVERADHSAPKDTTVHLSASALIS